MSVTTLLIRLNGHFGGCSYVVLLNCMTVYQETHLIFILPSVFTSLSWENLLNWPLSVYSEELI